AGAGLELVGDRRSRPVGVDVVASLRPDLRLAQSTGHRQDRAFAFRWRRHVEGVVARAVADYLRVDSRVPPERVLQLLQQEGTGAFEDHEAVAISIEGP